jgi:hypothetical protein
MAFTAQCSSADRLIGGRLFLLFGLAQLYTPNVSMDPPDGRAGRPFRVSPARQMDERNGSIL